MTGSLQAKHGKYYAVLNIKVNGKSKPKWFPTGITNERGNKRKAEAAFKQILAEYDTPSDIEYSDVLFADYLVDWLNNEHKNAVEVNTYESYQISLDTHIYSYYKELGVTLKTLKPQHIQNYIKKKLKDADGIGLSATTIQKHHSLVRHCLQHALRMNLIPYNPADRVTLPKKERFTGGFYNLEQARKLLAACKGNPFEAPIRLALEFGLRRGEAAGLKWSAIDFAENVIRINHTKTRCKTEITKDNAKNKSSLRSLIMLPDMREFFLSLKAKQEEEQLLCGSDYIEGDYICRHSNGTPMSPDYISSRFPLFLKQNNLPKIRYHDLRHSTCAILLSLGLNIKEISAYLGHNQISTTLDIYGHIFVESKSELAQKFSDALTKVV